MGQTIVTVDAFTDRPFAGNPAAVCVLDAYPDDTRVHPGHMGLTTLGRERATNPFLAELSSR